MTIYLLCDPETGEPHYVGETTQDPQKRLLDHLAEARRDLQPHRSSRLRCWLRNLLQRGLKPELVVLEETDDIWAERDYIQLYREQGYFLLNRNCPLAYGGNVKEDHLFPSPDTW